MHLTRVERAVYGVWKRFAEHVEALAMDAVGYVGIHAPNVVVVVQRVATA